MYIIGIDVGGTNTDGALIHDGEVVAMAKGPTDHNNLIVSTSQVLQEVLQRVSADQKPQSPVQLHLSTTLSTNAIVEGTGTPTAAVVIPGPGVNIETLELDFPIYSLGGYVDHRGRETAPLNHTEIVQVLHNAHAAGAEALAIAGKFSHRNSVQEDTVAETAEQVRMQFSHITRGHRLSGSANFPRRIVTAYLNARVASVQAEFAAMIRQLLAEEGKGVLTDVNVLKADGGTMTLDESTERCVETILSGPAASIMGALALSESLDGNSVVIDIGGTTTDIAVLVDGEPLLERNGAEISGYRTLVPALLTRSIGLGGDSEVHTSYESDGRVRFELGPKRAGPAVVFGGRTVTPTDAVVALKSADLGNRNKAIAALTDFGQPLGLSWRDAAAGIVDAFTRQLAAAIKDLYQRLDNVPLYTVSEILAPPDIQPQRVVGLGAPAEAFVPLVGENLQLPWEVLPFTAGANAVGAAAARPTAAITFHADTELARMTIPELGYQGDIERALLFDHKRARKEARGWALRYAEQLGLEDSDDIHVIEDESFNVIRGFHTVGRIFTIRAQLRPKVRRIARRWNM